VVEHHAFGLLGQVDNAVGCFVEEKIDCGHVVIGPSVAYVGPYLTRLVHVEVRTSDGDVLHVERALEVDDAREVNGIRGGSNLRLNTDVHPPLACPRGQQPDFERS